MGVVSVTIFRRPKICFSEESKQELTASKTSSTCKISIEQSEVSQLGMKVFCWGVVTSCEVSDFLKVLCQRLSDLLKDCVEFAYFGIAFRILFILTGYFLVSAVKVLVQTDSSLGLLRHWHTA